MKTPKFWSSVNIISVLLYPFGLLYFLLYRLRCIINIHPYKSKIPVICVGNLTAGGSGKTPLVIELSKILKKKNKNFCFLGKGYGGSAGYEKILKVNINDDSKIVGDESLLLVEYGDTYVSKSRVEGLQFINENYAEKYDYIIMDDGLQNPTFVKDKVILVINGEYGLGNGIFLPAGPLRSRLNDVKNIDLVVINGEDKKNIDDLCKKYNLPYTIAKVVANVDNIDLNGEYVAFCGLGLPEKFRKTLLENKIKINDFVIFGDHYGYTIKDIERLRQQYKNTLITTKKDWVKLDFDSKKSIKYLDIFLEIDDKDLIEELLK